MSYPPISRQRVHAGLVGAVALGLAVLALGAAPDQEEPAAPEQPSLAEPPSPRIVAGVADKLAAWRGRRLRDCRRRALEEAYAVADSLILDYARERKLMLDRPARPLRPVAPPLLRPSDTLALTPFLGDTL